MGGIDEPLYDGTGFLPVAGLVGVLGLVSTFDGLAGLFSALRSSMGRAPNVSPIGTRCLGLEAPRANARFALMDCLCCSRSSVALIRASSAWSSDVCEFTAFFLR